jgi:hypothetical protein
MPLVPLEANIKMEVFLLLSGNWKKDVKYSGWWPNNPKSNIDCYTLDEAYEIEIRRES